MKLLNTTAVFLSLSLLPTLSSAQETKPLQSLQSLTCPNSGQDTPALELNLTGAGGFELAKDQTMFLPLQFEQATMDNADSQKRVKLSCIYNVYTEKKTAQKTITLIAYTSPGVGNCKIASSTQDSKLNQLVCKANK